MSCSTGEWTVITTLSSCQALKSMKTAAEPNSSRWVCPSADMWYFRPSRTRIPVTCSMLASTSIAVNDAEGRRPLTRPERGPDLELGPHPLDDGVGELRRRAG